MLHKLKILVIMVIRVSSQINAMQDILEQLLYFIDLIHAIVFLCLIIVGGNKMKLLNKIFFYGLTLASLNLLSCNKESSTEVIEKIDYLKPLLGSWRQIEQNNYNLEDYIIRITFSNDPGYGGSYYFFYNDTANSNSRAYRAKIEEITDKTYKTRVTHQYGSWNWTIVGETDIYHYYIQNNRLYENDGYFYNVYRKE